MPSSKKAKAAHKKRLQEAEAAMKAEIQAQEALLKKQRPTPETYNTKISNRKPQPQKCSEIFQRIKYLNIIIGFISPAETRNFTHIIKLSHVSSYFREAIVYFAETFWINAVKVCTDFYPSSLPFPNPALLVYDSGNNKDSNGAALVFVRPPFAQRFRSGLGKVLKSQEVGDWFIQAMVYQGRFDINYIFDDDVSKLYDASYLCADFAEEINSAKVQANGNDFTASTKYFEKAASNESCKFFLGQAGICKNQQEADLRVLERRLRLELCEKREKDPSSDLNSFTYSGVGSASYYATRGFTCLSYLLNPNRDKKESSGSQDNGELGLVAWPCIKNLIELGAVVNPTLHDISNDDRQFTSEYHYLPARGSGNTNTNNSNNNSPYTGATSSYNFTYKMPPKQTPFRRLEENVAATGNIDSTTSQQIGTATTFSLHAAVKKQFATRLFLERAATPLMEIINPDTVSSGLSSSTAADHPFIGSIEEHVARIRFVLDEGRGGNASEKVDVNEFIRVRKETCFSGYFNKTRKFSPKPGKKTEAEMQKLLDSICWEFGFYRFANTAAGNIWRFNALVIACEILTPASDYAERRLAIVKMLMQEYGAMPQPHLNVVNYYNPNGMLSWEQIYENISKNNHNNKNEKLPEAIVDLNTFYGHLSELTKFKYLRNPCHRTTMTALSTAINACDLELMSLLLFGEDTNNDDDDGAANESSTVAVRADPNVTNLWTNSPIADVIDKLRNGNISKSFGVKMVSMLIKAGVNCCEMNLKLHFCDGSSINPWPLSRVPQNESLNNGNDDDDDVGDGRFSRVDQVGVTKFIERSKSRLTWLYGHPPMSDCNSVLAAVVCIVAIPQIVRIVLNDGGAWKLFHYARPEWEAIKKYCLDAKHHREEFKVIHKLLVECENKKL